MSLDVKQSIREAVAKRRTFAIISHPEQGWSLLCNGIVVFEDTGELLPDGEPIAPHRPTDLIMQPARSARRQESPAENSQSPAA